LQRELIAEAVRSCVLPRALDGERIVIDAYRPTGSQTKRSHGQETAAGPDIQHSFSSLNVFFQPFKQQARRRMVAGPERLLGVQDNFEVMRLESDRRPTRPDHETSADAKRLD
jgi:hypothetical protein